MEIKVQPIEAGKEPLLFVVKMPGKLQPEERANLQRTIEHVRSLMPKGGEIPWIYVEDGEVVLLRKEDAESPESTQAAETQPDAPEQDEE